MVRNPGKKCLYIFLFTYLIFALMGSLALSITKTFDYDTLDKNKGHSEIYFSPIKHTVDWLAVNTNTICKANRNKLFRLHSGLIPILLLAGFSFAAFCNNLHFLSIENRQTINTKSTILLKLRI